MKIAIFGSCVSRDTCGFMASSYVVTYVARHSVTSLETPHGTGDIDLSGLTSDFQKRMVTGDLKGDGLARLVKAAIDLDLILLDLVDERRGYWLFPDGTTMTNSLEVESCGAARDARRAGARLIEFGSDEHFENWKSGFKLLIDGLQEAKLLDRTILLDIEWAAAVDGAQHPQNDGLSRLGRRWRRLQRGTREASRGFSKGQGVAEALTNLRKVRPTEAEEYADRAAAANEKYIVYREVATAMVPSTVTRSSSQVRINRSHMWGPQPFHFRDEDYRSIVQSVLEKTEAVEEPQSDSE